LTVGGGLIASTVMKLKWTAILTACMAALFLTGCVGTLDGRKQAGVPFQKDRAEGRYQRPVADLWAAAQDVLKYHGKVSSVDTARQSLQGNVDERDVWISVSAVDSNISKVLVQARSKGGFGDYQMAAYLEKEIAVRLASGNLSPAAQPKR
jgi:hypothetical protein